MIAGGGRRRELERRWDERLMFAFDDDRIVWLPPGTSGTFHGIIPRIVRSPEKGSAAVVAWSDLCSTVRWSVVAGR